MRTSHSHVPSSRRALKSLLAAASLLGAGMAPSPAQDAKPAPAADGFYKFINATGGRFTDEEISWTLDGKTWHTLKEAPTAPAKLGGGGRVNFKMTDSKTGETWKDFIEFTHGNAGWFGNTTQVDAFVIPLTIELVGNDGSSHKVGIEESRAKLFELFRKQAPKEFQSLVQDNKQIVSPHRADFQQGKANGDYFAKYVDEVWAAYAQPKTLESGWTGKIDDTGALIFTKPGEKDLVLHKKPTTTEILLGTNELGRSPGFCAAFNRHVAEDPGKWKDASAYYQKEPYNFYAKFWHEHALGGKAYGFCYDDYNQQDTLVHVKDPKELIVTLYWDKPPAP